MPLWIPPLIAVVAYPGFLFSFDWAINGYRESGSPLTAICAALAMLLAASVPALPVRALLVMRHDAGPSPARGMLYLMFATPSLFTLTLTLTRLAGVKQLYGLVGAWVCAWLAVGLMLHVRNAASIPAAQQRQITWLRMIHGGTAVCLLGGFLLAHLANHGLASWSVELHHAA